MNVSLLRPRKALNGAYLKLKPNRQEIESFKSNLKLLLETIDTNETEEFHKNIISDFLKNSYYSPNHFINTKGRNDLVIHNGKTAQSSVGVIIEAKKFGNKSEMITKDNLNAKAFHELILYYLRERIINENLEVKNLVITNVYEWFIFDATIFEQLFVKNKSFLKQFKDFHNNRLAGVTTDFFYNEIAKPFLNNLQSEISFTYFDLRDYKRFALNEDNGDDHNLIPLYKILSPEHILKLPFLNDSNSLDKAFYSELLHIIGLTEVKVSGKHLINRPKETERNDGTLIENTINQLDSLNKIHRLNNSHLYGQTQEEQLFNVALDLNITWINRILFLKLLEAQLISYHMGDKSYSFLNFETLRDFDELNSLFFEVLAKTLDQRQDDVREKFKKVPYLNSSLFEPTEIEHQTLLISNLKDDREIPILSGTVLKDQSGKRRKGSLNALEYLFEFLNSYDFSSEGSEYIQEENKTLINASVLGLIFEKINGYKDGSFFTPGMITMYVCRETLRQAVIKKFNETLNWNVQTFDELYNKIEDKNRANAIVNSIRICDPAVGSGHFLVSALNEMIAIKNDLKILQDKQGRILRDYHIEVENDELIVSDDNGKLFEYHPTNKESARVQETLFHEKQVIIENCLFGVDINPNSVKICRLRLWIELLKNAYYTTPTTLETLPNIDINIKNGNSLISRFDLNSDLKNALKQNKISITAYREAVKDYKNAHSKEQKWKLEKLIDDIKNSFRTEVSKNSREVLTLNKLRSEYYLKYESEQLFASNLTKAQLKDKSALEKKIDKIETAIQEIKNNKIYQSAFEWRFEFPEVIDDNGNYIGFDAIIGNPPYIQLQKMREESATLKTLGYETYAATGDIYGLFYELGHRILKDKGALTYITSNKWMRAGYGEALRSFFYQKTNPQILIDFGGVQIFENATVDTNILTFSKEENSLNTKVCLVKDKGVTNLGEYVEENSNTLAFDNSDSWIVLTPIEKQIKEKIERIGTPLKDWDINIYRGVLTGYNEAFIIDGAKREELIAEDPKSEEIIRPLLRGRDIKRYSYEFADLYLITTFPSLKIDIEQYPAVKEHLMSFGYDRLKQTGDKGSRKKTSNKWFETQDSISYWEDFNSQKIVWPRLMRISKSDDLSFPRFSLVSEGIYTVDSLCFITGKYLDFLTHILNSKVAAFYFFSNIAILDNGGMQMRQQYVENLRIPKYVQLEKFDEIDNKIYELYQLNSEEIRFINEHIEEMFGKIRREC